MPKFNLDINLSDAEIAEAREDWKGPLPPKGSYPATLKVVKLKEIANGENKGKFRMAMTAVITDSGKYDGCPVFGGCNLTEQGAQFVNQFLFSLVKTESEFKALQKAMQSGGLITDEKKEHVTKIGRVKIDSPDGEKKILISLGHNTYQGNTSAKILSFLPFGTITDGEDMAADEDEVIEEEEYEDDDSEDEAGDESMFEDEDEDEESAE